MLITLDEIKSYCRVADTTYDTALSTIASGIYYMVSNLLGGLDSATYTDTVYLDSPMDTYIFTEHYPIQSVTSLSINGTDVDLTQSGIVIEDYYIRTPYYNITRYEVTYTAGYDTLPSDLKYAILWLIKQDFINWKDNMGNKLKVDERVFSITPTFQWPDFIMRIIGKYKRIW